MSENSIGKFFDEDFQLGQLDCLVLKYTIRCAIEKLLILNFGRKRKLNDVSLHKEPYQDSATEIELENNTEKIKASLVELCSEIESYGTFEKLSKCVMENQSQETIENNFLRNYAINKSKVEYLEKKMPEDVELIALAEKTMRLNEAKLAETSLNTINNVEIEKRYITGWESGQLDQLKYAITKDEHENYKQYDRFKVLLGTEEEAAANLIDCYQTKIHHLENNLKYWNSEYERQMESISTDIHLTKEWILELERKIEGQQNQYITYKEDVESFLKKRARVACAKKIQRWWRQILLTKVKRSARIRKRPKKTSSGKRETSDNSPVSQKVQKHQKRKKIKKQKN